ncbi:unnamed protein product [Agarophyton chilense]
MLPEALTAFMLLENLAVDNGQRVSVLAAAWSDSTLSADATTIEYLYSVKYEKIASVLRQCDDINVSITIGTPKGQSLDASAAPIPSRNTHCLDIFGNRISPTLKIPCDFCRKFGLWKRNHNADS